MLQVQVHPHGLGLRRQHQEQHYYTRSLLMLWADGNDPWGQQLDSQHNSQHASQIVAFPAMALAAPSARCWGYSARVGEV